MSMFSSRTREQIGCTCYMTDPSAWFRYGGAVEPGSQWEANYECFEHFPHEQHNPTNPILAAFRADGDPELWELGFTAYDMFGGYELWEHPKNRFHAFTVATREQIEHARRVLTRLVALTGDAS